MPEQTTRSKRPGRHLCHATFCVLQPDSGRCAGGWRCWAQQQDRLSWAQCCPQACSPSLLYHIHVHLPHFVHLLTWCFSFFFARCSSLSFLTRFQCWLCTDVRSRATRFVCECLYLYRFKEGKNVTTTWFWMMLEVILPSWIKGCLHPVEGKNTDNWSDFFGCSVNTYERVKTSCKHTMNPRSSSPAPAAPIMHPSSVLSV